MCLAILSDWISQIIIFIFIGSILELIIPNNSMKRYVHIVVGLILLLILIKPILYLFSTHVPSAIEQIEHAIFNQDEALFSSEKQIDIKENEIHEQQDAYIWNEVKSQMVFEANKALEQEALDIAVSDIQFQIDEDEEKLEIDNINKIIVTLTTEDEEKRGVAIVQPIEIGKDYKEEEQEESPLGNKVRDVLASLWRIDIEKIEYIWEEGAT